MVKKLKEERSFNNFNDLRKFLTFIRMKNDFRTKLIRDFTANVYAVLKNVYKYLLMFLASASYLAHIRENLKEIKDKRITMPDGEIQLDSFEVMHQQEVQTLLSEYSVKQENSFLKFKGVLDSQIISKILGNYMGREEEKKIILECDNILKYIEDAKNGKLQPAETYDRLFLKISNKPDVHITDKLLNDCQEADVKTYAQIRIIGHLDEVVVNANFKQDDYLRMKKQDIENKNKAELIEFIRLINSNK